MAKNFWLKLKKPIFALAPMADVTDFAFREMFAKYGKPSLLFTEFVSVDGLCSRGKENLMMELKYSKKQRPIIAQIFGTDPEKFFMVSKWLSELGFDGIDINMGCPDKKIVKQGAGSALILNPKLAKEIILSAKKGAGKTPVSVKTRIGFNQDILESWLPEVLAAEPVAITIHGRTKKEMSKVPANWDRIAKAVEIRNELKSKTLILGNGDVWSLTDAIEKVKKYGVDGVMVGRGAFGNPWFFNPKENINEISLKKRFKVMIEHTKLFEKTFKDRKNFSIMKKHFKAYVNGFEGAKPLRIALMSAKNSLEIEKILKDFLKKHKEL